MTNYPRERRLAGDGLFIREEDRDVLFIIPVLTSSGQPRLLELRASLRWATQLKVEIDARREAWLKILETPVTEECDEEKGG